MEGGEVCYSIEYNIYISPRQHCYYLLMQTCFIVTLLFLHPSFLNREVQHLCDSQSTKCEEHNHCCKGQLAQLGARLHVVSPSSSSDKSLSSPSAPPSPSLIPLLSSSHLLSTSEAWVLLLFFFHLLLSIKLPPSPLFQSSIQSALYPCIVSHSSSSPYPYIRLQHLLHPLFHLLSLDASSPLILVLNLGSLPALLSSPLSLLLNAASWSSSTQPLLLWLSLFLTYLLSLPSPPISAL